MDYYTLKNRASALRRQGRKQVARLYDDKAILSDRILRKHPGVHLTEKILEDCYTLKFTRIDFYALRESGRFLRWVAWFHPNGKRGITPTLATMRNTR